MVITICLFVLTGYSDYTPEELDKGGKEIVDSIEISDITMRSDTWNGVYSQIDYIVSNDLTGKIRLTLQYKILDNDGVVVEKDIIELQDIDPNERIKHDLKVNFRNVTRSNIEFLLEQINIVY